MGERGNEGAISPIFPSAHFLIFCHCIFQHLSTQSSPYVYKYISMYEYDPGARSLRPRGFLSIEASAIKPIGGSRKGSC